MRCLTRLPLLFCRSVRHRREHAGVSGRCSGTARSTLFCIRPLLRQCLIACLQVIPLMSTLSLQLQAVMYKRHLQQDVSASVMALVSLW